MPPCCARAGTAEENPPKCDGFERLRKTELVMPCPEVDHVLIHGRIPAKEETFRVAESLNSERALFVKAPAQNASLRSDGPS